MLAPNFLLWESVPCLYLSISGTLVELATHTRASIIQMAFFVHLLNAGIGFSNIDTASNRWMLNIGWKTAG